MKRRVKKPPYCDRGITISEEFLTFDSFLEVMGERPPGGSIDRIDNNGNSSPDNCRWATMTQQNRNKRSNIMIEYQGKSKCISEWAEELGMTHHIILQRYNRDMTPEQIFTTPIKNHK